MTTIHQHQAPQTPAAPDRWNGPAADRGQPLTTSARRALAVLRIGVGLTFLWAFLDKTFALGFHTGYDEQGVLDRFGGAAWIHGGSPTEGFLAYGATGPFTSVYHSIAGAAWADWMFMLGLLGIGLAVTLGVGMRVAAAAGALLYVMMWTVVLPPENNPVLDDHLIGAVTVLVLALTCAGDTWGLGRWWSSTPLVRDNPALR